VSNPGRGIWDDISTILHFLPLYTIILQNVNNLGRTVGIPIETGPDLWEIGEILEIPYTHPGWKLSPLEGLLRGPEFRIGIRVVSY
jgi:hypothetical protein